MSEASKTEQTGGQGHSTAALVLGILAIVASIVWYIGIPLGVIAIILGVNSLKKQGHKKAVAGIVTGVIGIVISLLIVWTVQAALPALQKSQRDTARKNDVTVLTTDVLNFQTTNRGQLPAPSDLSTSSLGQVTALTSEGDPTTDSAVYSVGKNCDGASSERAYSITILLENGSIYCQGS